MKTLLFIGGFIGIFICLRMIPAWHYPWFKKLHPNLSFWLYVENILESLLFGLFVIFSLSLIYNQQWQ